MVIPASEKRLGYEGDNAVATRVFQLTDMTLSEFTFKLDTQKSDNSAGIVALSKAMTEDHIQLTWPLLASEMDVPGELIAQLRAYNDDGEEVWHSGLGVFVVATSIHASGVFSSPLPTEFQQFEATMTAAVELVQSVAERIGEISQGADGVSVTSALVLDNGHLMVILSSGVQIDCGSVIGPRGPQGTPGLPGAPGQPGQNGNDGQDGTPGRDGVDGVNGQNGQDGQDGKDGQNGADGYTPVRGVDYWTASDIEAIENAVTTELAAVAISSADVEQKDMVVTYEDDSTETLKLVVYR